MSSLHLLIVILSAATIVTTEPCNRKLDVSLVVDASSTVCKGSNQPCPEWYSVLEFCKSIVGNLTIGLDESRVAFVKVSDKVKMEWSLLRYTDLNSLLSAISGVVYNGGELTNLLSTATFLVDLFVSGLGDRLYAPNVLLWMTNGIPAIDHKEATAAATAFQKSGITLIVVCITPGCTEDLAKAESSPPKQANETYFLVNGYLSLGHFVENLMNKMCTIPFKTLLGNIKL